MSAMSSAGARRRRWPRRWSGRLRRSTPSARRRRRNRSAAATWSCSWSSRRSVARLVARCSSTRAAVSLATRLRQRRQVDLFGHRGDGQGGGANGVEVAQSAVCLFEVGLEKEGDVAMGPVALVDLGGEHGEPQVWLGPATGRAPGRAWARPPSRRRRRPCRREARVGPEGPLWLPRGPRRDGVRSGRGGCLRPRPGTTRRRPPDVMSRRPLWTRTTSRSLKGHSSPRPYPPTATRATPCGFPVGRLFEQAGQPLVGGCRECGAEGLTLEVRSRKQLLAQRSQGHGRR